MGTVSSDLGVFRGVLIALHIDHNLPTQILTYTSPKIPKVILCWLVLCLVALFMSYELTLRCKVWIRVAGVWYLLYPKSKYPVPIPLTGNIPQYCILGKKHR